MGQVTLTELQDTFIKAQWKGSDYIESVANTNFNRGETADYLGCGVYLDTSTDPDTKSEAIALIKAETDQWAKIPPAAVIDSAWLHIFTLDRSWYQTSEYARVSSGAVYGRTWDENTVTWSHFGGNPQYYIDSAYHDVHCYHGRWARFDVTWWARKAKQDGWFRRAGIMLHSYDNTSTRSRIDFASRNHPDGSKRPYVVINYHMPSVGSFEVSKNSPQSAIFINGSGLPDEGRVRIEVSSDSNGPFGFLDYASRSNNTFSYQHEPKAPAPTAPSIRSVSQSGSRLVVDWNGSAQPGISRYYKVCIESGGETGPRDGPKGVTLTPSFSYVLQRRRAGTSPGDPGYDYETVYSGDDTQYTDSNVTPGVEYNYKVFARNSQGSQSGADFATASVEIPDPPSITSVTTPDDNRYLISGTGAFEGGKIRVYYGGRDDDVTKDNPYKEISTPNAGEWSVTLSFDLSPPAKPSIDSFVSYEDAISLSWEAPSQGGIFRKFAATRINPSGIESRLTPDTQPKELKPTITGYRLERKLKAAGENFKDVFQSTWSDVTSRNDTSLIPDSTYIYRLSAKNSAGLVSTSDDKEIKTKKPSAPHLLSATHTLNPDGSYRVRVEGNERDGAQKIKAYRYNPETQIYAYLKDATLSSTGPGKEYYFDDVPPVSPPDNPTFSQATVDLDGVHLRWRVPVNPSSSYRYKASRVVSGKEGDLSNEVSVSITPQVVRFVLQRRVLNEDGSWSPYQDLSLPQPLSTSYDDNQVDFSSTYQYRLMAVNDRNMTSRAITTREISTIDAPPPPPPPEPPEPPVISDPQPSGTLPISGSSETIRFSWSYYDENLFPQTHYLLRRSSGSSVRYWNASSGSWQASEIYNQSGVHYCEVPNTGPDAFQTDTQYSMRLIVRSSGGVSSEPLDWDLKFVRRESRYFDLHRRVRRSFSRRFDLYRKINLVSEGEVLIAVEAGWDVEERKPLVVRDVGWEGGGNAFPWVVYDRDGRPEPYAELDFVDSEGNTTTFRCDERGRIVLRVPDDIRPGIYRLRERGSSMAPRTTENFVVYDPWIIYRHGHRHSADGPDPIYGITRDQIADDANISPSQIEGGSSLMQLVDRFGPNVLEGLERHLSSGHGNYVVEGLNHTLISGQVTVSSGICWESGRLRQVSGGPVSVYDTGIFKVYVLGGQLYCSRRDEHPPGSCPLYTLTVSSGSVTSVRDDRLRHPSPSEASLANSVTWGPSLTNDVLHNGVPLSELLDPLLSEVNKRLGEDEALRDHFERRVSSVQGSVQRYMVKLDEARLASLGIGRAVAMRTVISHLEGDSLLNPPNVGLFRSDDELSGLSTIEVREGVGVLPEGWNSGKSYLLRTMRIYGAPSRYLEFLLFYEDTGAVFDVKGSLGRRGTYPPVTMDRIFVSRQDVLVRRTLSSDLLSDQGGVRTLEEVVEERTVPLRIATYRASFDEGGDEAIVELYIRGGNHPDGVRIRGWAVVMA